MNQYRKVMLTGVITMIAVLNVTAQEDLRDTTDRLHRMLWTRMVDRNTGILFDYTAIDGKVEVPTPEECRTGKPNAISWWTPIENGAFFNGLYIDALCTKWQREKRPETKAEIKKLAAGLLLLQEVGNRPGFIARGVSTDGRTHYPIGSDDQTFPWFYGLWKYLNSGIPDAAEKKAIVARMNLVARAVKDLKWCMPCEAPYDIRGGWGSPHFAQAVRLLFVNRIMLELTGDAFWRQNLQEVSSARLHNGKNRIAIIAEGDPQMRADQTWIHASSVAALREMLRLETDPERQRQYREGLSRTGAAAAVYIGDYTKFKLDSKTKFSGNWRVMNKLYRPQPTVRDAVNVAMEEIKLWNAESPRIVQEKRFMMLPLFAAWIVLLSGDDALIVRKMPQIEAAMRHYRWEELHYSACFVGENIFYSLPTGK